MSDTSDASTYSDYDDLSSEVDEYARNVDDFEQLVKDVEPFINETRIEMNKLNEMIDEAMHHINETKRNLSAIRAEKKACEDKITALENQLQGLSANNDALQKMVTDGSASMSQIAGRIIANNRRYKVLTDELERKLNQFDGADEDEQRTLVTLGEKQDLLDKELSALEQTLAPPV